MAESEAKDAEINEMSQNDFETHRTLHTDPEKLDTTTPEQPKRRQPFSAVWTVIACGFALMSDGFP